MSLQELHIKALEQQVVNLTRDCHYLMSLLNSVDEIDWDNWEQGRKIKKDLERSEDFFCQNKQQKQRRIELERNRLLNTPDDRLSFVELKRKKALIAAEAIRRREAAQKLEVERKRAEEAEKELLREEEQRRAASTPWWRKKIDVMLEGHETESDYKKFFDYLFGDEFSS